MMDDFRYVFLTYIIPIIDIKKKEIIIIKMMT